MICLKYVDLSDKMYKYRFLHEQYGLHIFPVLLKEQHELNKWIFHKKKYNIAYAL